MYDNTKVLITQKQKIEETQRITLIGKPHQLMDLILKLEVQKFFISKW